MPVTDIERSSTSSPVSEINGSIYTDKIISNAWYPSPGDTSIKMRLAFKERKRVNSLSSNELLWG